MENPQSEAIKNRLFFLQDKIRVAAEKSGRPAGDVCLVAVVKTVPADAIAEAIRLGIEDIGENRVQEAVAKRESLSGLRHRLHMIGHLQTNKAKKAVELADVIQSVDRPELAEVLSRAAEARGKIQRCFIEVKISPEESKWGVSMEEAPQFIKGFKRFTHLKLEGLMTIPPFGVAADETRAYFRKFKIFFDSQKEFLGERPVLSMGMTDDFQIAIEEGSSMVRIGRGLFGERK